MATINKYPTTKEELGEYLKSGMVLKMTKYNNYNAKPTVKLIEVIEVDNTAYTLAYKTATGFKKTIYYRLHDFVFEETFFANADRSNWSGNKYHPIGTDAEGKQYRIDISFEYTDMIGLPMAEPIVAKLDKNKIIVSLDIEALVHYLGDKIKTKEDKALFVRQVVESLNNKDVNDSMLTNILDMYVK